MANKDDNKMKPPHNAKTDKPYYPHDEWAIRVNQRLEARYDRAAKRELTGKQLEVQKEAMKLEKARMDFDKQKHKAKQQLELQKLNTEKARQALELQKAKLEVQHAQIMKTEIQQVGKSQRAKVSTTKQRSSKTAPKAGTKKK